MPFHSHSFILGFLPLCLITYYALGTTDSRARFVLGAFSLVFYAWFSWAFTAILLGSLSVNYGLNVLLQRAPIERRKTYFITGLVFNLGLLCLFKYEHFFVTSGWALVLPLGMSFYTLQQVAHLVDNYQEERSPLPFGDYALFVLFFPTVISGPITRSEDLVPQFSQGAGKFNARSVSLGIYLFTLGLCKKVLIADSLATWVDSSYDIAGSLSFFSGWATSLSYTFQLYFDFSGYSDMAVGLGWLFNLSLPQNFNSPLKATNINDFWTRWHMTLSRFIRTYMFTTFQRMMPVSNFTYNMIAMLVTMTIVGAWHGGTWNFVAYGALHGLAIVAHYNFKRRKFKLPTWAGWFLTFNFVNISFVLFRAGTLTEAWKIYRSMLGLNGVVIPKTGIKFISALTKYGATLGSYLNNDQNIQLATIVFAFVLIYKAKNTLTLEQEYVPESKLSLLTGFLFAVSFLGISKVSNFIYFNF